MFPLDSFRLPSRRPIAHLLLTLAVAVAWAAPLAALADDAKAPPQNPGSSDAANPANLEDLKKIEERVRAVARQVIPAIVGIKVGSAGGSGVVVSEDGLVLTAGHVVGKPGQDVTFYFADGRSVPGKTLGLYRSADAGMMRITKKGKYAFVEVGDNEEMAPGKWLVAMGHPFGFRPSRPPVVRVGRLIRASETTLQTDCPLISGDSGGPLLDLNGKLVGINSRIGGGAEQNFHVPVGVFVENWDRLLTGDNWLDETLARTDDAVKEAFKEVVSAARQCVAVVKADDEPAALGVIAGPNGWILTKASEIDGKKEIKVTLTDRRELPAEVVGIHTQHDLAMLKIEADALPRIDWTSAKPPVGSWLATVGVSETPLAVGALSTPTISIPPQQGKLGIVVSEGDKGPKILKVLSGAGADKAGLKAEDVIVQCDGKRIKKRLDLTKLISRRKLGDTLKLLVLRGGKELSFSARLLPIENEKTRERQRLNASTTGLSKRRDNFPAVLQHDTVLRPDQCGGPVVDLSGKVVGINIARGGRTETYCIPTATVLPLMYDLMSGRLAPPKPAEAVAEKDPAPQAAPDAEKKQPETPAPAAPSSGEEAQPPRKAA